MGFLSGRVTFVRYRVAGDSPLPFDEVALEAASAHAIGRHGGPDPTDGIHFGWSGGRHVLDMTFELGQNVVNDSLHIGMRIDADKIPSELLRAYTQMELDARIEASSTGRVSKAMREEAKEAARIRAEAEGADGRFRRRKMYPVLWDGQTQQLYAGVTSLAVLDRLLPLFRETFGRALEPVTAGSLARDAARAMGRLDAVDEAPPLTLHGQLDEPASVVWAESDPTSIDYWGNEFLLWLWHTLQADGDTIPLEDGSEVTVMMAKTLTLDCPRGQTGRDSLSNEGPTRLPEALRALQSGKLPRKAGLILDRHGMQYDLTLQAESFAVSGAAIPKIEDASRDEVRAQRIDGLRHLTETLDLLYQAYVRRRIAPDWSSELGRIRQWLTAA